MASVGLESVTVQSTGGARLLTDVSFAAEQGEYVVLVGPSGSGKTSIIRTIAGLERVSRGKVRFDGADFTERPTRERDVGIVFQSQALFPSYDARRNVGFPLRIRKLSEDEIRKRVVAEARALGIEHILGRWPRELSAGHQQLVQLARALVRVPNVLLLDEPMAHLDPPMQSRLRRDLKELQRGYGVTTVHATNHPIEAMTMADRIVAIDRGRVPTDQAVKIISDLHKRPSTTHLAWLTGAISFVDAVVVGDSEGFWLVGDGFRLRAWPPELRRHLDESVQVGLRPESIRPQLGASTHVVVEGPSFESGARGTRVRLGSVPLQMEELKAAKGETVAITVDSGLVYGGDGRLLATLG